MKPNRQDAPAAPRPSSTRFDSISSRYMELLWSFLLRAAYDAGTRFLHKVNVGSYAPATGANSDPYSMDGFFKEPRGLEIIPEDPLTGN